MRVSEIEVDTPAAACPEPEPASWKATPRAEQATANSHPRWEELRPEAWSATHVCQWWLHACAAFAAGQADHAKLTAAAGPPVPRMFTGASRMGLADGTVLARFTKERHRAISPDRPITRPSVARFRVRAPTINSTRQASKVPTQQSCTS